MPAGKYPENGGLVPEGWRRLHGLRCGFGDRSVRAPEDCVTVRQVHGTTVRPAAGLEPGHHGEIEADALTTTRGGPAVAVTTADCVPILLVEPESGWAAAVHAGWRGTVAGIAQAAVRAARDGGVRVERLLAALGPSIGPCCYEVGTEVADRFAEAGLEVHPGRDKPRLDLRGINRRLLIQAGVPPRSIALCGPCTCCHHRRYWSYRADRERCGRQQSWIGWEARCDETDRPSSR
ncbi:MAG: peptidoglycan editing factor PgeF [Deltaproteobacteria bacterium]|nr:MAG: peptidoglycan editing factor PgeF [Deltaproteobacteria bacterium]